MTSVLGSAVAGDVDIRVQLLHVADCPLVGELRTVLQHTLARNGLRAQIEELEGPYPSPTLLVDGVDVTGRATGTEPSCRLDLPSEEQILAALIRAADARPGRWVSSVDDALTGGSGTDGRRSHQRNCRDVPHPGECVNATQTPNSSTTPVEGSVGGAPCGPRPLCGWSPASLPADTTFKRRADLIRGGNLGAIAIIVIVVGLLNLAPHVPLRGALALDGIAALVGGAWCSLNFWRCRHAHCLVSGPGWLAFGLFALVEAGLGRSLIGGNEQLVFLGLLGVALAFEGTWFLMRHSNAVVSG